MTLTLKYRTAGAWGSGEGRKLTAAEIDGNFYAVAQEIAAVAVTAGASNQIATITGSGSTLSIIMQDATEYQFDLPVAEWRDRGAWLPSFPYLSNDIVSVAGKGIYRVRLEHISDSTFDEDASTSDGDLYSKLISMPNPAGVIEVTGTTLVPTLAQANSYFRTSNASPITVYLESGVFPANTELHFRQNGYGSITVMLGDSGGYINVPTGFDSGSNVYGATFTAKLVNDNNEWDLFGSLAETT